MNCIAFINLNLKPKLFGSLLLPFEIVPMKNFSIIQQTTDASTEQGSNLRVLFHPIRHSMENIFCSFSILLISAKKWWLLRSSVLLQTSELISNTPMAGLCFFTLQPFLLNALLCHIFSFFSSLLNPRFVIASVIEKVLIKPTLVQWMWIVCMFVTCFSLAGKLIFNSISFP